MLQLPVIDQTPYAADAIEALQAEIRAPGPLKLPPSCYQIPRFL